VAGLNFGKKKDEAMTTKEQIIQELEQVPEEALSKVLELVRALSESKAERVWQAYLESEQEREEVYRRLAN
jgi:hypothetical protein